MAEAFPLCWPASQPRSKSRRDSDFKRQSFAAARDSLFAELGRLGARKVILSTNVPLRQDGLPRADFERRLILDPGVAVYFEWRGKPRVLAADKWNRIEDNLRAIEKTIDSLRGCERWGVSQMLEQAFTGFTALPAPEQWWDVLGVKPEAPLEVCEIQYRVMIKRAHPDAGGSEAVASKLNWAISCARELRR